MVPMMLLFHVLTGGLEHLSHRVKNNAQVTTQIRRNRLQMLATQGWAADLLLMRVHATVLIARPEINHADCINNIGSTYRKKTAHNSMIRNIVTSDREIKNSRILNSKIETN